MTDAFNPPKTLSEDDVRRVADVRRDVWTAGIKGAVGGVFVGSTGWLGARALGVLPKRLRTPNHFSLCAMGGGALVSFLCSLAAGKNSVQRIGDVFTRGAKAPDERLPISALQHRRASSESADAVERRRRRDAARPPSDEDRYGFAPKPE